MTNNANLESILRERLKMGDGLFFLGVVSTYLLISGMSEIQTLGYQDTHYPNIYDSQRFATTRYSCGTKQALPCIEKLTGKDDHTISIKYVL